MYLGGLYKTFCLESTFWYLQSAHEILFRIEISQTFAHCSLLIPTPRARYSYPVLSAERLKNTLWRTTVALIPKFARADDAFAERLLPKEEHTLYLKMDVRDRDHACTVTKTLLADYPDASCELLRAALLHDVGKTRVAYNPLSRIVAALYTPWDIPAQPHLSGVRGLWQIKRHHHRYGAQMIRLAGGSERVAEIVAKHHHPAGDADAARLKEVDERF